MSVRRRDLIAALAVMPATFGSSVNAQQPPTPAPPADRLQQDLQSIRETSQKLSQLSIPIELEPAFTFKA